MAATKKYKFPHKLVFNTRALVALEDIANEPLNRIIIKMNQGSFKSTIQLVAAGASLSFDETLELVDQEIEKGMSVVELNEAIDEALQGSVFMKNPEVQKALKEIEAAGRKASEN